MIKGKLGIYKCGEMIKWLKPFSCKPTFKNWNEILSIREKGIEFIIFFLEEEKEEIADHVKYIWKGQHKRVARDAQSNVIGRPKRYYACKVEILSKEYNVVNTKMKKIDTQFNFWYITDLCNITTFLYVNTS